MEQRGEDIGRGCGRVIGMVVLVSIALTAAVWAWTSYREGGEAIRLTGDVTLSAPAAAETIGLTCDGDELLNIEAGGVHRTVEVSGATRTADGCTFRFAGDVPVADVYTFRLGDLPEARQRRSQMDTVGPTGDTELRVRLSW